MTGYAADMTTGETWEWSGVGLMTDMQVYAKNKTELL